MNNNEKIQNINENEYENNEIINLKKEEIDIKINEINELNIKNVSEYREKAISYSFKNKKTFLDNTSHDLLYLIKLKSNNNIPVSKSISIASPDEIKQHGQFAYIAKQLKDDNNIINVINYNQEVSYIRSFNNESNKLAKSSYFSFKAFFVLSFGFYFTYKYTKNTGIINWDKHFEDLLDLEENK